MDRLTPFAEGEYYHIYNRGVDKRKIFFSAGDWKHFQFLLFIRNSEKYMKPARVLGESWDTIERADTLVDICAYSFMPNHFHLLLREKQEGGTSKFMAKLLTSFSMYMNKKYDRTGPLMCRPFRAKHVDTDEYFRWLISYIHANPIELIEEDWKKKMVKNPKESAQFLREYVYSSYYDYFVDTNRQQGLILNKDILPIETKDLESVEKMFKALSSAQRLPLDTLGT